MSGPVFLVDDRLTLRLVQPDDHEFIVRYWNKEPVRQPNERPQAPLTREDVTEAVEDDDRIQFLPCLGGGPIGHVSYSPVDLEARNPNWAT